MTGGSDRVVIRPPHASWPIAVGALWTVIALTRGGPVNAVFPALATVVTVLAWLRSTILTPEHLVVRTWRGSERHAWPAVEEVVAPLMGDASAYLRDGTEVPLPGVIHRATVPEEHVAKNSAQAVVAYGRRHGGDLTLR